MTTKNNTVFTKIATQELGDGQTEFSFTVQNKNGEFSYIFKSKDRGMQGGSTKAVFTKGDFHDLSEFFTRSMEAIGDVE